jgi:hypothetical protein
VDRTGERFQEATLLIGKSRLLTNGSDRGRSSRAGETEACLWRALEVAHVRGARLYGADGGTRVGHGSTNGVAKS